MSEPRQNEPIPVQISKISSKTQMTRLLSKNKSLLFKPLCFKVVCYPLFYQQITDTSIMNILLSLYHLYQLENQNSEKSTNLLKINKQKSCDSNSNTFHYRTVYLHVYGLVIMSTTQIIISHKCPSKTMKKYKLSQV